MSGRSFWSRSARSEASPRIERRNASQASGHEGRLERAFRQWTAGRIAVAQRGDIHHFTDPAGPGINHIIIVVARRTVLHGAIVRGQVRLIQALLRLPVRPDLVD